MDKERLLNYYKDYEDRALINNIFSYGEKTDNEYLWYFTDFLDPRQMSIAYEAINPFKTKKITCFGGIPDAERHICCIHDIHTDLEMVYPPLSILKMTWKGFKNLTHRDFLGTLIGQGIKREKIGDIVLQERCAYLVLDETMASYVIHHIEKIGGEKIISAYVEQVENIIKETKQIQDTVASLRLDAIIASGFKLSRSEANDFIKSGKAFVNWQKELSSSKIVEEKDAITIRGKGRMILEEINGTTKKDRYKICIKKYT